MTDNLHGAADPESEHWMVAHLEGEKLTDEERKARMEFVRDHLFPHYVLTGSKAPKWADGIRYSDCTSGCHRLAWLVDEANGTEYRVAEIPKIGLMLLPGMDVEEMQQAMEQAMEMPEHHRQMCIRQHMGALN
jgi:hypothetical protein